jgi:multidrug efflux pump subunit AcrA (membrane-fusion protein)
MAQLLNTKKLRSRFVSFKKKATVVGGTYYKKATVFVKARPMKSFFIVLGLLLAVLILGQVLQRQQPEKPKATPTKPVKVFGIGESPKATFQAKVEKTGVVKIVAQTAGVVQSITVTEGDKIGQGQQLISLASNYQGGNAASVQRQIAQTQYQNTLDTYDQQVDVVRKQREVANQTLENAEQLRRFGVTAAEEASHLINANQAQLNQMKAQLEVLRTNGGSAQDIATLESSINQMQAGINQLLVTARTTGYQSNINNPPTKLADLQKAITLKQLEIQEKGLGLSKEVARLQLSLAYVSESTMYPASPFAGVVERIYVHKGQTVNPGTVLAVVTANDVAATAVLTVPATVAQIITTGEPSEMMIDNKKVALVPYYVSTQATDGQMYSVFYDIPEKVQSAVSDQEFITVSVPVSNVKATANDPFIPIDAVYQSEEAAFVLVAKNNKAESRQIKIGRVYGNYVQVLSGLQSNDQVIIDRNVVAGDKVTIR